MRRLGAWCGRHPLAVVAAVGIVAGAVNLIWVASSRRYGGFDVDEVGYLAHAHRFSAALRATAPRSVWDALIHRPTGPLVPLLAGVTSLPRPGSIPLLLAVEPLLVAVAAVGVTAICRRLAGPATSIVAGCVVVGLPVSVLAARTFQLAGGVTAAMVLGVLALLSSDRGRRRGPMVAFGAAVGLMLVSRAMAVVYLPGLAVAAVVVMAVRVPPRRWPVGNALIAATVALVVVGPWWWTERHPIWSYLWSTGYGNRAEFYGSTALGHRLGARLGETFTVVMPAFAIVGLAVVVGAIVAVRRTRRVEPDVDVDEAAPPRSIARRELAALWSIVIVGYAVLLTTANQGTFFDMPLLVVGVAGVAGLVPLLDGRTARIVGVAASIAVVATLAWSATDADEATVLDGPGGLIHRPLYRGSGSYRTLLLSADPRLGAPQRSDRLAAMSAWWAASVATVRRVGDTVGTRRALVAVAGSSPLVNSSTLDLARLRDPRGPEWTIVDATTAVGKAEIRAVLDPGSGGRPDVAVVIRSKAAPFAGQSTAEPFARIAAAEGWRRVDRQPLPDGGSIDILVPG